MLFRSDGFDIGTKIYNIKIDHYNNFYGNNNRPNGLLSHLSTRSRKHCRHTDMISEALTILNNPVQIGGKRKTRKNKNKKNKTIKKNKKTKINKNKSHKKIK